MNDLKPTTNQQLARIDKILTTNLDKLAVALQGSGISPERFRTVCLNSLRKNPDLMKCDPFSLWECFDTSAVIGIEIGGPLPLAYLVPYGTECKLILSYRGWIELVRRSGRVKNVQVGSVREGDVFEFSDDTLDPHLKHKKSIDKDRHKKPITHVWAGFLMDDGCRVYDVMTRQEIDAHKEQFAKGWQKKDSAWQTSWEAMALKTVVTRPIRRGLVPIAQRDERQFAATQRLMENEGPQETPTEPEQIPLQLEEGVHPLDYCEQDALACMNAAQAEHHKSVMCTTWPDLNDEITNIYDARKEHLASATT